MPRKTKAPAKPKRKVGRPRLEFDLEDVEGLGRIAATAEEMAGFFGCCERVIRARMAEPDGKFMQAYEKGCTEMKRSLRRKQIELAKAGDRTMLIWLGKQHLGQTDKQELAGKEGSPLVVETVRRVALGGGDDEDDS